MLKVAVVGLGNIGNIHASVYASDDLADLVAVCDIIPERADKAAQQARRTRLLQRGRPARRTRNWTRSASPRPARKTAATTSSQSCNAWTPASTYWAKSPSPTTLSRPARWWPRPTKRAVYFGINLNHRFVPPAAKAKEWVDEGKLGDLLLINMTMWINNPNDSSPWFHLRALHPHSLDIMRYFCGDVTRVHAFVNHAPGRVCYSNAQVNLEFANGVVGHLTGSYDANPRHNLERCEVMGTEGRFVLENLYQELTLYPRHSDELTVIRNSIMGGLSGFGATFTNRIHRWLEQVDAGVPRDEIEASGKEGLAVQEIIEAAIRSVETGKAEAVPVALIHSALSRRR